MPAGARNYFTSTRQN